MFISFPTLEMYVHTYVCPSVHLSIHDMVYGTWYIYMVYIYMVYIYIYRVYIYGIYIYGIYIWYIYICMYSYVYMYMYIYILYIYIYLHIYIYIYISYNRCLAYLLCISSQRSTLPGAPGSATPARSFAAALGLRPVGGSGGPGLLRAAAGTRRLGAGDAGDAGDGRWLGGLGMLGDEMLIFCWDVFDG